jgi:hypothetical protein
MLSAPFETPISTSVAGVLVLFEVTCWIVKLPVIVWPRTVSVIPVPASSK